ncbi:MAG: hypothetical protein F4W90_10595 [Gammaproteobacteria bacterium]|nr:hypothetical protein [Gammaproteobacteria bacterium]
MRIQIGVGDLAMFVHRRGDIDDRSEEQATAREGIATQRAYQQRQKLEMPSYDAEVRVARDFAYETIDLRVSGRIDGVAILDELHEKRLVIEEIKTTRKNPNSIPLCDRSVHEAQVRLYAGMFEHEETVDCVETRLTYVHPDTNATTTVETEESIEELDSYFEATARNYCEWLHDVCTRIEGRNASAAKQMFPFETYNESQLPLARAGYVSLRDETNLLFEAPTGTGKTIAATFPAVKAIGEGDLDRVVYATARTTGQRAAASAFSLLQKANADLIHVTVSAKERVCLTPGAACRPDECEYAKGHYDRVRDATKMLLRKGSVDRAAIDAIAKTKKVCPFELSLDVAEWSDAVICDYNYVFDPLVQLSRLQSRLFKRVGLLVDEAHRLTERVRDMLSCAFDLEVFDEAVAQVDDPSLARLLQPIQNSFTQNFEALLASPGEIAVDEFDSDLKTAVDRLFDADAVRLLTAAAHDAVNACLFELMRLRTIHAIRDDNPAKFVWLLNRSESSRTLTLRCLLPDAWIRETTASYHGSIRFSGTMSPGELFNEEHGLTGPIKQVELTPDKRRLSVFVVPNISTYWSDRAQTAPALAQLITQIQHAAKGSWLIAFPSFAYLELVAAQLAESNDVLVQKTQMNLEEREEFLSRLALDERTLAFVVMGGVFTESIDIEQSALEGVVVVSPGLPPQSLERERLKALSPFGYEIAYRRPAMTRVVQAAGRVVRSETDRGVVVLIDPRYTRSEFTRYFPSHWAPQIVKSADLVPELQAFQKSVRH